MRLKFRTALRKNTLTSFRPKNKKYLFCSAFHDLAGTSIEFCLAVIIFKLYGRLKFWTAWKKFSFSWFGENLNQIWSISFCFTVMGVYSFWVQSSVRSHRPPPYLEFLHPFFWLILFVLIARDFFQKWFLSYSFWVMGVWSFRFYKGKMT